MFKIVRAFIGFTLIISGAAGRDKTVKEVLESQSNFDETLVKQLLVRHDLNHLLLSDINKLMAKIGQEFPDLVKLSTIGYSREDRPIVMMTIESPSEKPMTFKPAMFLTGAHHAREFVSSQMPIYSVLRMIHGSIHGDERYHQMIT
jgi:hypothetical protein